MPKSSKVDFWDEKYKRAGFEWGKEPSLVAELAAEIMKARNLETVLDIGCGYGRDCIYLGRLGFKVTGIDTSAEGLNLAKEWARNEKLDLDFRRIDITKNHFPDNSFDAVIMYNTLHLMDEENRRKTVHEMKRLLKNDGILVHAVLSSNDGEFGKGCEVEYNSFDSKGGRPMHFFTRAEIMSHFRDLNLLGVEEVKIHEVHSSGEEHNHVEWLVCATKLGYT